MEGSGMRLVVGWREKEKNGPEGEHTHTHTVMPNIQVHTREMLAATNPIK
eukprot:m.78430 g.78430  ORF g.78430 m.78430 type:complete len:50 (-) comp19202_c0_seq1:85-234(-)